MAHEAQWDLTFDSIEVVVAQDDSVVFDIDAGAAPEVVIDTDDGEDCVQFWWSDGTPVMQLSVEDAIDLADRIHAAIRKRSELRH